MKPWKRISRDHSKDRKCHPSMQPFFKYSGTRLLGYKAIEIFSVLLWVIAVSFSCLNASSTCPCTVWPGWPGPPCAINCFRALAHCYAFTWEAPLNNKAANAMGQGKKIQFGMKIHIYHSSSLVTGIREFIFHSKPRLSPTIYMQLKRCEEVPEWEGGYFTLCHADPEKLLPEQMGVAKGLWNPSCACWFPHHSS